MYLFSLQFFSTWLQWDGLELVQPESLSSKYPKPFDTNSSWEHPLWNAHTFAHTWNVIKLSILSLELICAWILGKFYPVAIGCDNYWLKITNLVEIMREREKFFWTIHENTKKIYNKTKNFKYYLIKFIYRNLENLNHGWSSLCWLQSTNKSVFLMLKFYFLIEIQKKTPTRTSYLYLAVRWAPRAPWASWYMAASIISEVIQSEKQVFRSLLVA